MADKIISHQKLKEIFNYKDGNFYWKKSRQKIKAGAKVGTLNKDGYIHIRIDQKRYLGHRLIFLYHYGYIPKYIDHINNNKSDNKIENLREATREQNAQNKRKPINNKSGTKNVYWRKTINKWAVQIKVKGITLRVGVFDNLEFADLVAQEARDLYHGKWANHS